jgi:hypothetical protein
VRALSELRERISGIADETWQERVQKEGAKSAHFEPFGRIIEYDNEQMKIELLPHYYKMLKPCVPISIWPMRASGSTYRHSSNTPSSGTGTWMAPFPANYSQSSMCASRAFNRSTITSRPHSPDCAHPLLGSNRPTLVEHLQPAPEVLQCRRPRKFDDTLRPQP